MGTAPGLSNLFDIEETKIESWIVGKGEPAWRRKRGSKVRAFNWKSVNPGTIIDDKSLIDSIFCIS